MEIPFSSIRHYSLQFDTYNTVSHIKPTKEQTLDQVKTQLTNSDIATHNKNKEILDVQKTISDEQQKFYSALLELKRAL